MHFTAHRVLLKAAERTHWAGVRASVNEQLLANCAVTDDNREVTASAAVGYHGVERAMTADLCGSLSHPQAYACRWLENPARYQWLFN